MRSSQESRVLDELREQIAADSIRIREALFWRDKAEDERDRAIETRENANAVSVRVEAENRRLRETPCGRCKVLRDELNQAGDDRDRYRAALEEALEWVPEPERTTIAEALR